MYFNKITLLSCKSSRISQAFNTLSSSFLGKGSVLVAYPAIFTVTVYLLSNKPVKFILFKSVSFFIR